MLVQTRRRLLMGLAFAGAGLVDAPQLLAGEGGPETTTVRLAKKIPVLCNAPQYIADELLRAEGFTDIQHVTMSPVVMAEAIGRGDVDLSLHFVALLIPAIDAGGAITMLAGVHVGCFELFANEDIRRIRDLKGKRVGTG